MSVNCRLNLAGIGIHTDFTIQILFFHLAHKVDLVENLQPVGRCDLPSDVLASFSQLIRCDSVAIL